VIAVRIEQQGYIEVQPQYQHVGYLSAAVQGAYLDSEIRGAPFGLMGLGVIAVAGAFIVARRMRPCLARGALACGLLLAGLWVGHLGIGSAKSVQTLSPDYYVTLRNIEEACALTEAWTEELGRLPTDAEWSARMEGRPCALDGWGRALVYDPQPAPPPPSDGQLYVVSSRGMRPSPEDFAVWAVHSTELGPDGLFGTPDDNSAVRRGRGGDWTIPTRYEHGRTAREATP